MLRREESRHDFAFIAGVVIGAVAGAIATLALTPMSGNETREMIRSRVGEMDDIKAKAASMKEKAAERATEMAQSAQPMMDKVKTQVSDIAAKSPLPVGEEDTGSMDANVTEMTPSSTPPTPPPTSTTPPVGPSTTS